MPDHNPGLGDIQQKDVDPQEQFYDIARQGVRLPPKRDIVSMPGKEKDPVWRNLMDFWQKLQCGTYFVKGPNWLEPPVTARPLDIRTETCVTIAGGTSAAVGVESTLFTFTIPDRHVGTLLGFGHELVESTEWGNVLWTLKVNEAPQPLYHNFRQQIGRFVNPTKFPAPFRVKSQDVIKVTATKFFAASACAFARLIGFYYPVREISQDGTYKEYHTPH